MLKPNAFPSWCQGNGTRQPSRPFFSFWVRSQIGSCRAFVGRSATSCSPRLLPLVEVRGTRQGQHQCRRGAGPAKAGLLVGERQTAVRHQPLVQVGAGRQGVAGRVPHHVMVRQHPGRRRARRRSLPQAEGDRVTEGLGVVVGGQQVEVEGLTERSGPGVEGTPGTTARTPRRPRAAVRRSKTWSLAQDLRTSSRSRTGASARWSTASTGVQRRRCCASGWTGPWPGRARRRSGTRRHRARPEPQSRSRTRRGPSGAPSSGRAARRNRWQ